MVLFDNINVNQQVEVLYKHNIEQGIVKFKGCINGYEGDWVGVQLNRPVGEHDGMLKGRRYFHCPTNHGIFCDARDVRFKPMKRRLYSNYQPVEQEDIEQESDIFGSSDKVPDYEYVPRVSERIAHHICDAWQDDLADNELWYTRPKRYNLKHSISRSVPAATMHHPRTPRMTMHEVPSTLYTPGRRTIQRDYDDVNSWISSPSIPKTHMPHSALERQVQAGWDGSHYTREMSVNNGIYSAKMSQWNGF